MTLRLKATKKKTKTKYLIKEASKPILNDKLQPNLPNSNSDNQNKRKLPLSSSEEKLKKKKIRLKASKLKQTVGSSINISEMKEKLEVCPELKQKYKKTKISAQNDKPGSPVKTSKKAKKMKHKMQSGSTNDENQDEITETFKFNKNKKHELENTFSIPTEEKHLGKVPEISNKSNKAKEKKKSKKMQMIEKRLKISLPSKHPDAEKRTIFVGNVDLKFATRRRAIQRFFKKYGKIEAVRIRGIATSEPGISKKEAITTGKTHSKRDTVFAFVRFEDEESVNRALEANGCLLSGHHIRVDKSVMDTERDNAKSIFVGNLSFEAENEKVHEFFRSCGNITDVRIVRSNETGASKGFCLVSFETNDAVELALQMNGQSLYNRPLRIKRDSTNGQKDTGKFDKLQKDKLVYKHQRLEENKKKRKSIAFMKHDKPQHVKEREYKLKMDNLGYAGQNVSEKGKDLESNKPRFTKTDRINKLNARILESAGGSMNTKKIFED